MKRFLLFFSLFTLACSGGDNSGVCEAPTDAVEDCTNGVDDNCDGKADCDDESCAAECGECTATGEEICGSGEDEDCDGAVDCADSDCASGCIAPEIYAAPFIIQGLPGSDATVHKLGEIRNLGSSPITLSNISIDHAAFSLSFPTDADSNPESDGAMPKTIDPNASILIRVGFTPTGDTETAKIVVESDAPKFEIPVVADNAGPCLEVRDAVADFGEASVDGTSYASVEVENCSEVEGIELSSFTTCVDQDDICEESGPFEVVSPSRKLVLLPRDRTTITLGFNPDKPGAYSGLLTIKSATENATVRLRATAVEGDCPTASVASSEIDTTPQTTVDLEADAVDEISEYMWTVLASPHNAAVFVEETAQPSVYVELAGEYIVELRVKNSDGIVSCGPRALVKINALPTTDVYVEATWDSPLDPNQHDEVGTDLDLHFLHPNGAWDQPPWDVYWRNQTAEWGATGEADNPHLTQEDDDGHGPEVISYDDPEPNMSYAVGLYNFSDNDYGGSYATTRIFIRGEEKFQKRRKWLDPGDFWHVANIEWPSAQILIDDEVTEGFPVR